MSTSNNKVNGNHKINTILFLTAAIC